MKPNTLLEETTMAGRPKTMVRRVEKLELLGTLLAVQVFEAAPSMYREDKDDRLFGVPTILEHAGYQRDQREGIHMYIPGESDYEEYNDLVERGWLACMALTSALSIELEQLGILMRRKAGMGNQPGPVEELLGLPVDSTSSRASELAELPLGDLSARLIEQMQVQCGQRPESKELAAAMASVENEPVPLPS